MSGYRFCRTDDITLLVDALNRCWAPHFPDEPPMTPAAFKRSIRDLQVWCSSCMVAFQGSEPIGVLIGAKRAPATLVHKIAVHPDHVRQGHARHMLESLGSKLAILGPPRIVAEVPEALPAAGALFRACGFVQEGRLTDYVGERPNATPVAGPGLIIPVTVDDLAANGLLGDGLIETCWQRSVDTLRARKDEIAGLAAATEETIEAFVLYIKDEIQTLAGDEAGLTRVLSHLPFTGRFPKVHPDEIPPALLETLGFRDVGTHALYATTARSA